MVRNGDKYLLFSSYNPCRQEWSCSRFLLVIFFLPLSFLRFSLITFSINNLQFLLPFAVVFHSSPTFSGSVLIQFSHHKLPSSSPLSSLHFLGICSLHHLFTSSLSLSLLKLEFKKKFLYSKVSSSQNCSKHFTLYFPDRPVHSDTISASLGSIQPYAAINARRLLVHISTTVYSQILIYTAEWTGAMLRQNLAQCFNTAAQDLNPGSLSRKSEALSLSHWAT